MWKLALVSLVVLGAHGLCGDILHKERPDLGILPPLITHQTASAASFGDQQFLFRTLTLQIQNAGDDGGRFTPMRNYDIPKVIKWLRILQFLDSQSIWYLSLATRYFSQTPNLEHVSSLISFIDADVSLAPERKWYWQTQAVALAQMRLKNLELALSLSRKIANFGSYVPTGYMWALQIEPIILEDLGRFDEAKAVMDDIKGRYWDKMNEYERSWTFLFYDRLSRRE